MKLKLLFLFVCIINSSFLFGSIQTKKIQKAHLAGSWYPADKQKLTKDLDYYFSLADKNIINKNNISAIIVPHAGYRFSGLCAANAYQTIKKSSFDRVIIIGPSHNKSFNGIALPNYTIYKTPMGKISIDKKAISKLSKKSSLFKIIPNVHQKEHSIEIQLPFLDYCLNNFSIVPLIVGKLTEADFQKVAKTISTLLNDGKKTLIVISSDFIHYGPRFNYTPAFSDVKKFDTMAIEAILEKSYIKFDDVIKKTKATICGESPIKILLKLIETGALGQTEIQLASYYNSAQIEDSRNGKNIDVKKLSKIVPAKSSVSYASLVCRSILTPQEKNLLLKSARNTITHKLFPEKKLDDHFTITDNLKKKSGAFVTIKTKSGKLRGCIGRIISNNSLYKIIPEVAQSTAFHDSRFLPLTKKELDDIVISITVLSPPRLVKSYNDIILGKHGIILEKTVNGFKQSAVYLPQVPEEQGWNLTQTLNSLSKKAGLKKDDWKKETQFKVFEGFEFSE
ncbi:AmmeMemoRadiSam system protein B [bacterium]|nr:AmmeMemoRadiSam system protein B [bacterium]